MRLLPRRDEGVTVVEVLITITLLLTVMGTVTTAVVSALRTQTQQVQQAEALTDARTAFERMTARIRQANPILEGTGERLRLEVRQGGIRRVDTYELTGPAGDRTLLHTRAETVEATGTTTTTAAVPILEGVRVPTGTPIFTYFESDGTQMTTPVDGYFVSTVRLEIPVRLLDTNRVIDLATSVQLRNGRD